MFEFLCFVFFVLQVSKSSLYVEHIKSYQNKIKVLEQTCKDKNMDLVALQLNANAKLRSTGLEKILVDSLDSLFKTLEIKDLDKAFWINLYCFYFFAAVASFVRFDYINLGLGAVCFDTAISNDYYQQQVIIYKHCRNITFDPKWFAV